MTEGRSITSLQYTTRTYSLALGLGGVRMGRRRWQLLLMEASTRDVGVSFHLISKRGGDDGQAHQPVMQTGRVPTSISMGEAAYPEIKINKGIISTSANAGM